MDIVNALNKIWYYTSLSSLKNMHSNEGQKSLSYNSTLYLDLIYFMGNKCTASILADILKISKPGVTLKINQLTEQNYVIKTPSEKDKRINYLSINEKKVREYSLCKEQVEQISSSAKQCFNEDEIKVFCKIIDFICQKYQEDI